MIKIIDAKSLINNYFLENGLIDFAFAYLIKNNTYYPDIHLWIKNVVKKGIVNGERKIILNIINNEIAGIAIIKDTQIEKKICCLRVFNKYINSGCGVLLFKKSMELLQTEKPLLTIEKGKIECFTKIFNYFGYLKTEEYPNFYKNNLTELSFNGLLKKDRNNIFVCKV